MEKKYVFYGLYTKEMPKGFYWGVTTAFDRVVYTKRAAARARGTSNALLDKVMLDPSVVVEAKEIRSFSGNQDALSYRKSYLIAQRLKGNTVFNKVIKHRLGTKWSEKVKTTQSASRVNVFKELDYTFSTKKRTYFDGKPAIKNIVENDDGLFIPRVVVLGTIHRVLGSYDIKKAIESLHKLQDSLGRPRSVIPSAYKT